MKKARVLIFRWRRRIVQPANGDGSMPGTLRLPSLLLAPTFGLLVRAEMQHAHRNAWSESKHEWCNARGDKPIPVECRPSNQRDRRKCEPKSPGSENVATAPVAHCSWRISPDGVGGCARHSILHELPDYPIDRCSLGHVSGRSTCWISAHLDRCKTLASEPWIPAPFWDDVYRCEWHWPRRIAPRKAIPARLREGVS